MVAPCVQRTSSAQNLQLRLGVDHGVVGEHQVLVGLLGIGLLRVLADEDLAVEDRVRLAVQDALVQLVAGGVRLGVVDGGVIVHVLRAVDDVESVQRGLGAFREERVGIVAHQRAAERNRVRGEVGAAAERGLQGGDVEGRSVSSCTL